MQIVCRNDSRLIFEAEYHDEEPETGECGYSRGTPKIPAHYEITAVAWRENEDANPVDITDFVNDFCDKLFAEWEESLND